MASGKKLSHFDAAGGARMVDVGAKAPSDRRAVAAARVRMQPETRARVRAGTIEKGDVLGTARVAAVQAAKRTADLVPMCHPLAVTGIEVRFEDEGADAIAALVTVRAHDRTGVEMEALTGAAVAALTIYDMCKAIDRWMTIEVRLLEKEGGKSGRLVRPEK
jgi:cyclic pyranopterin phosphate synthase